MDEGDNQGGWIAKFGRVTKMGLATGGIAARMAGSKLGLSIDTKSHAEQLVKVIGNLKGPAVKAAQILAMVPDLLPTDYSQKLSELQANAPAMGWSFVQRRMAGELGADWQAHFLSFSETALNAASLGQVHQARSKDGRLLACKLQYPDMQSVVDTDLRQLKMMLGIFEKIDGSINTEEAWLELQERLKEELDYQREARHILLYRHLLATHPEIHVPEVIASLSTRRLLTMSWLTGKPIKAFFHQGDKAHLLESVARSLFYAWYLPLYQYGILHGDPHPGNYTVREDGELNLLDYGCVRIFSPQFVEAVIDLYHALQQNDTEMAVAAYQKWGFKNLSKDLVSILNQWAKFVYGPILEDREQVISENLGNSYTRDLALKVRTQLRAHGAITLPREFVMMDRAAVGLGSIFIYLRVRMNWYKLFHELIDGFQGSQLAQRQQQALCVVGINP